jgi:predicted lactoylglutathione lyase
MLLYLYSERYFNITTFKQYEKIFAWDKQRFYRLIKEGWIELFSSRQKGRPAMRSKALYCLSYKAKRMVNSIYKKLEGEEIPETMCNNPMFKKNVRFSDKVYRNMIITMNQELKENRLTGQELRHVPE